MKRLVRSTPTNHHSQRTSPVCREVAIGLVVLRTNFAGTPASQSQSETVKQEPLVTVADAAKDAGALLKAEDLDWTGQPKKKGPPRLAMPGAF